MIFQKFDKNLRFYHLNKLVSGILGGVSDKRFSALFEILQSVYDS